MVGAAEEEEEIAGGPFNPAHSLERNVFHRRAAAGRLRTTPVLLCSLWCEVAGDVQDQLRDPRSIRINLSVGTGHDRHIVGDGAIQRVQGGDQRFRFAVGP